MNRKIKFRAWDKNGKTELDDIRYYGRMIGWEDLADETTDGYDGSRPLKYSFSDLSGDDYIFMQYTGLKDKSGKPIFEGDVVRILYADWPSMSSGDKRTLEQYLKDIASIKVIIWKVQGFYVSESVDGYASSMEPGRHGYIEVIGNIYENPELLNPHINN